ncbi:short chain dehydrogenase [Seiridium cupressi]
MAELLEMARVTLFGSRNDASHDKGSFDPSRDIPSLAGKIVLVTGGSGDLGRQTTIELARHGRPARIYIADLPRSDNAKKDLVDQITREAYEDGEPSLEGFEVPTRTELRFLDLDLTSLESVRACAAEFIAREERLDILILNAGIIRVALGTTREGYEIHLGLNYLGHALLSRLLVPTLVRTAEQHPDVRIVAVSSEGHAMAPKGGIQFDRLKTECSEMSYSQRYGQSKVAIIGLARELGRHYPQLKIAAVHPGRILTGMAASLAKESLLVRLTAPIAPLLCVPVTTGVRNHLWAATSPDMVSGKYYDPVGIPDKETTMAKDEDLSRRLWEWTEDELEMFRLHK